MGKKQGGYVLAEVLAAGVLLIVFSLMLLRGFQIYNHLHYNELKKNEETNQLTEVIARRLSEGFLTRQKVKVAIDGVELGSIELNIRTYKDEEELEFLFFETERE